MEYSQKNIADSIDHFPKKVPSYYGKIILDEKKKEVSKHKDAANLFNNIAIVFNSYFCGCLVVSFL